MAMAMALALDMAGVMALAMAGALAGVMALAELYHNLSRAPAHHSTHLERIQS